MRDRLRNSLSQYSNGNLRRGIGLVGGLDHAVRSICQKEKNNPDY